MNRLSLSDRAKILHCLVEGNSMRATSRLCDVSINTVTKLLLDVGTACAIYQNEVLRNLQCKRVQCDEIWSFCGTKERNVDPANKGKVGYGDVYTWTAIDSDSKLCVSFLVGRRDIEHANIFVDDLAARLANRIHLSTDGNRMYVDAVANSFAEIDYGMLVKHYSHEGQKLTSDVRYSPSKFVKSEKRRIAGDPEFGDISTSYVERQNLTMRMGMRRFTRLTNAFSKKMYNLECAVALHFMFYNFGRIHKTLRVTPAMEAGIAQHVWTLEEIAALAD
ncbi:MAG: IS1 family transposase [Betaproteobacteria bacterium]|nr:IS1 family transposase [Betaproteobacteria bacterium]